MKYFDPIQAFPQTRSFGPRSLTTVKQGERPESLKSPTSKDNPISRIAAEYFSNERIATTAGDIMTCGPAAYAIATVGAESIVGAGLTVVVLAKCIPELMGDVFFPDNANKALHSATAIMMPFNAGGVIAGGLLGAGERSLTIGNLTGLAGEFFTTGKEAFTDLMKGTSDPYLDIKYADWFNKLQSEIETYQQQTAEKQATENARNREQPGREHEEIERSRDGRMIDDPREIRAPDYQRSGSSETMIA